MRKYYWDRLGMSYHDDADKCHTLDGELCEQDYVLYSDVQSLQAERDRLREALETISKLGATDGLNAKVISRRALEGYITTTPERRDG